MKINAWLVLRCLNLAIEISCRFHSTISCPWESQSWAGLHLWQVSNWAFCLSPYVTTIDEWMQIPWSWNRLLSSSTERGLLLPAKVNSVFIKSNCVTWICLSFYLFLHIHPYVHWRVSRRRHLLWQQISFLFNHQLHFPLRYRFIFFLWSW